MNPANAAIVFNAHRPWSSVRSHGASLASVLTLIVLLAGCTGTDPDRSDMASAGPAEVIDPIWDDAEELAFISGLFPWHDPSEDTMDLYGLVAQGVVNPCLFDDPDDDEGPYPYFTNLQLTVSPPDQYVPNGTTHLRVDLGWEVTDWEGDTLWITWRGGDAERYRMSPPIGNGESTLVSIANDTWETGPKSNWDVWVCQSDGQGVAEGKPFRGDLDVAIDLVRIPEESVDGASNETASALNA